MISIRFIFLRHPGGNGILKMKTLATKIWLSSLLVLDPASVDSPAASNRRNNGARHKHHRASARRPAEKKPFQSFCPFLRLPIMGICLFRCKRAKPNGAIGYITSHNNSSCSNLGTYLFPLSRLSTFRK